MQKRNIFVFILAGLLTVLAGEFQVNVLVSHKGIGAYIATLVLYIFFLLLVYVLNTFLERNISSQKIDVVYYFVGGICGLAVEWLIGNAPWVHNGAIQSGMFAWWGSIFLIPRIFTTPIDPVVTSARHRIVISVLLYSIVSTLIIAFLPQSIRAGIAAILLTIGYITINFQFVPYLTRNGFATKSMRIVMWILALAAIGGVLIPG